MHIIDMPLCLCYTRHDQEKVKTMGSFVEFNDTLQITSEQGFPKELDLQKHQQSPLAIKQFQNQIFEFYNKPNIRLFHMPPVRVFLVHNINDQWLYWGLIHILELRLDYVNNTTSGKFKIIQIYTPKQMQEAELLIHPDQKTRFLANQNHK